MSPARAQAGPLYVVATPIGDVGDISPRAVEILSSVEFVACEDTRSAGRLLSAVSASGAKLLSCFEHNEERRTAQILDLLFPQQDIVHNPTVLVEPGAIPFSQFFYFNVTGVFVEFIEELLS